MKPGAGNDPRLIRSSGLNQEKLQEETEVCFLLTLTNKRISILNVNKLVYVLIVFRPTVAHCRWFPTVGCLKLLEFLVWGVFFCSLLFTGKCLKNPENQSSEPLVLLLLMLQATRRSLLTSSCSGRFSDPQQSRGMWVWLRF